MGFLPPAVRPQNWLQKCLITCKLLQKSWNIEGAKRRPRPGIFYWGGGGRSPLSPSPGIDATGCCCCKAIYCLKSATIAWCRILSLMCEKSHYDRLRNARALGNRKSDNNKNPKNNVGSAWGPVWRFAEIAGPKRRIRKTTLDVRSDPILFSTHALPEWGAAGGCCNSGAGARCAVFRTTTACTDGDGHPGCS